jgi:hypothetical protein
MNRSTVRGLLRRTTGGALPLGPDPLSPRYPKWLRRLTDEQLFEERARSMTDEQLRHAFLSAEAEMREDDSRIVRFAVGQHAAVARLGGRVGVIVAVTNDLYLARVQFPDVPDGITLDFIDLAPIAVDAEASP